ncbi:MAG: hypothetical protein MUF04_12935, partial [Akkermansiaceae bacterium]|nr:hypothetical protein [Akkermansiaceae bacterium]
MAHHAYEYFARYAAEENRDPGMRDLARHPLNMLRGTQVTALANALLAAPLAKPRTNARWPRADEPGQSWDRLFRLLLEHAPERLPEVLRWSGAVNLARPGELARIAAEMAKQGAAKEAGQLLAEAFFPPPPAADGPAFPPLVTDRLLGYESLPLSSLADAGLLGPLAEAAASAVPSRATAGTRVAVLLLADPREETWQRVAMPYLDGLEARDREQAMTALRGLLARRPEARDLYARLGQPRSAVSVASETLYTLPSKLAAAENPEDIATLWKRAVELLESKPERAMARRFLSSVAGRLTTAADDRVWREFLEHARRQSGFDRSECGMVSYIRLVTVPRQRRVVLLEWFAAMEPGRDTLRRTQEGWFDQLLAEQPPDHATLDFLHERMDWRPSGRHDAPAALVAYDLVKRRPEGASPAVVALLGADGACRVAWTLARRMPAADADPAALDFLDGAFDLEILAGGHPERLALVARVERAPAVGERVLRLPEEDARFVAVVARQRDGELVRLSAVERVADLRSGTPLALAPVGTDGSGLAVKSTPAGGPFGTDEVMSVTIPPGAKVELYRWPKPGPTLPWIAGWIMTSGPHCGLVLAASHGARQTPGERAEELKIAAGSFRNWRRVSSAWNREAPRTVTALALVASNHGDTPVVASLAGFVERPVQTVPQTTGLPVRPPPGAVRVGTLPGSVGDIGWDAADHSWAVISYDSLGVFEPDSGTFPGWKPLRGFGGDLFGQRDRWFAKTGKRIVCLTKDGAFHSYDLESETFADLGRLEGFDAEVFQITGWPVAPRLSPDGTLLATPGLRAGLRLTRIGPKMLQESRLLETGRILRIRFDAERGSLVACD